MNLTDLPTKLSDHQRYIFYSLEASGWRAISSSNSVLTPNYFNWTCSFRLDSDIRRTYSRIRDLSTDEIIAPPHDSYSSVPWRTPDFYNASDAELQIIKSKSRIAVWFVSHCGTVSKRENLVQKLKRHFKIDIYGSCGKLRCERKKEAECNHIMERDYFFYFSFENTLCKDYVTEKLSRPMSKFIIPVVYGGADYTKFAPPHSYINVMDFNSTANLANYLLKLSKNPVEYASYFWWKRYYGVEDTTKSTLCDLCEKLHNNDLPKKTIDDLMKYYMVDQCYSPTNLSWFKH